MKILGVGRTAMQRLRDCNQAPVERTGLSVGDVIAMHLIWRFAEYDSVVLSTMENVAKEQLFADCNKIIDRTILRGCLAVWDKSSSSIYLQQAETYSESHKKSHDIENQVYRLLLEQKKLQLELLDFDVTIEKNGEMRNKLARQINQFEETILDLLSAKDRVLESLSEENRFLKKPEYRCLDVSPSVMEVDQDISKVSNPYYSGYFEEKKKNMRRTKRPINQHA